MNVSEFRVSENTVLNYAEVGPRDGLPLVFLHGYTDSWFSFSRVLPLLPGDIRGIAVSLRGHGDSSRPPGPYRVDDFARDTLSLLGGLGIAKAVIAGHCMGSFVARRIAAIAPQRVRGLVLIAGGPTPHNPSIVGFANEVLGLRDPIDPTFIREFQLSTVHRPVPKEFLARICEESAKVPAALWKEVLAGLLAYDDSEALGCPTLCVGGDRDAVFPLQEQQELAQMAPHTETRWYTEVGHSPHWEIPEDFASDLVKFVRRVHSGRAAAA